MPDESIRTILQQRNISRLYHFTNANNLDSILRNGLQPRSSLENEGVVFSYNDPLRIDGHKNSVSLSVEFPNYKMFYRIRQEAGEGHNWAVLELSANILCDGTCAFCRTNASDASVITIPMEQKLGSQALLRLFDEWEGKPDRNELGIPLCYPTNPQAEVLVFECIPICYINRICFDTQSVMEEYSSVYLYNIQVQIEKNLFCPRSDHRYW